ncbi:hypothetical protein O181_000223 [Austropuccinia psidii MF-1]|uniref:HAT C-terminal dimerisation domain-containing protein n=1 Tax=Austropuccinia psidii MF-1 TaxID=1389203 RepID=A0A9Q3GAP8_9BASI|nr:hypothetical protein [Austropuccinia psidii MF-1]
MKAFMAITSHFIDSDYKLKSVLLGLTKIEGDHSGISLANHFKIILHHYELEIFLTCITTNNASANHCMAQEIKRLIPSFSASNHAIGCMAHTIHLAAHDGLNALAQSGPLPSDQEASGNNSGPMAISSLVDEPDEQNTWYNSIIDCLSKLASYIPQSPQRREKFIHMVNLIYEEGQTTKETTLLTNVCTRLNLTYDMLEQLLSLQDACIQFCSTDNMQAYRLAQLKWEKVSVMVNFLQPLYEETHIIYGSAYPKINEMLPLYILLIKQIHQACDQYNVTPIKPAAMEMTCKLSRYLKQLFLKTPLICASILDPQFKLQFFTNHQTTLSHFGTSLAKLAAIFEEEARKHVTSENLNSDTTHSDKAVPVSIGMGLFDDMYSLASSEGRNFENKIQRFFAEPPEPKETEILLFWKSRGKIFPTLSHMAQKYLSIPATSAPSEQVFSCGRKILTYQHASLSSMHIEQLVLHFWANIFSQMTFFPNLYAHLLSCFFLSIALLLCMRIVTAK